MKATVTSKGQITIPLSIRNQANITTGVQLDFQVEENGIITLRPLTHDISELKGIVKSKRKRPVTLKEMKNAIHKGATESMK